jgi:uncharacterized membrane protein
MYSWTPRMTLRMTQRMTQRMKKHFKEIKFLFKQITMCYFFEWQIN